MLHKAAWAAFVTATLAVVALCSSQAAPKNEMSARDQKELGTLIGKALDPTKQDLKDKEKSVAELRKFLEKAGKTRNAKDPLQGGLALTGDLSKALHLSANYRMEGLKPGEVKATTLGPKTDPFGYALWLPKSYKPDGGPYPVIVCFPGAKEGKVQTGESFLVDNWTDAGVREKVLIAALNLPDEQKSWTESETSAGKAGGVKTAMLTLKDLGARYAIDFDRIYLAGRESGVAAALALASKFPQNFAGVIGRSGDCGTTPGNNFRNLPTYFAGAGAEAAAFEEANKKFGYDNCTIKSDGNDADALTWINEHPRNSNPTKVTLYPGRPIPLRAYWLKVPATDITAADYKIEGEIDRAKNTITITSTGVKTVTLMLNDILVNLDKPVTIVLNGSSQDALLPRSLDDMLDMMFKATSEPGRVYVLRKDFDLPVAK